MNNPLRIGIYCRFGSSKQLFVPRRIPYYIRRLLDRALSFTTPDDKPSPVPDSTRRDCREYQ